MECNVRPEREAQKITLPNLADAIGVNKGTLSKIERGFERWTVKQKQNIEQVLGVEGHQWLDVELRPGVVLKVEVEPR